uniref:Smoothelin, like n=1 Tax=Neogobius melanostomus TaxID=47308 RepID=A0A8C6U736_9GOBI
FDVWPVISVVPCSPEGETVCAALSRCENTLRDAIREIHVDVSAFKVGMERRLEESSQVSAPLSRAVSQLQEENQQLKSQLEVLTRQVELLMGRTMEQNVGARVSSMLTGPLSSGSPSTTRFSSRATFALSSKNHHVIILNPDQSALVNGKLSPPADLPLHTAPPAVRMPHLPITATTKTAEIRAGSPVTGARSPGSDSSPLSQSPNSNHHSPTTTDNIVCCCLLPLAPLVKTWTPAPVRTLGSPRLQDKLSSCKVHSDVVSDRPGGERRRELVRSQTLPRNIGAQARRSIFEKLGAEANNRNPKPVDSKPKLKRSQSFGVSSASSIKQVLLEWCRSKTIGYQNIDIQNFSSSWSDGMAFCALVHSFFPTEFDYTVLSPADRKHNFEVAFGTAETKAGCDRLIEVDDMMIMGRKPDPMCVFTYVQSLYNHLRKFE